VRCAVSWQPTKSRCIGSGLPSATFLTFPAAVKDDMGNALSIAQFGGTAPSAKPWKRLGPGVLEIVEWHDGKRLSSRLHGSVSEGDLRLARVSKEVAVRHSKRPNGMSTSLPNA
jgi:hypothetical protein